MTENIFIKTVQRISDGSGIYLDKKVLKHLQVERGDLVKLELLPDGSVRLTKSPALLDEDKINDLLTRIDLDGSI